MQYSYRQQFHFFQETFADRQQRLYRPFMKPVDTRTVGDGRELTTPHTQCIAHRWETQHHLWSENKSKIHKLYILLITILRHLNNVSIILKQIQPYMHYSWVLIKSQLEIRNCFILIYLYIMWAFIIDILLKQQAFWLMLFMSITNNPYVSKYLA